MPAYTSGSSTLCSAVARGKQVERLEDEADFLVAHAGERVVGHLRDFLAVQPVLAGVRRVEAADDVHERRLARARRSHDGDVLVAGDRDVDAAQGAHDFAAHVVFALDAARHDHPLRIGRRARLSYNDLPLGGQAERGFCGVLTHDLVPGVGFFASALGSRTSVPSFSSRMAW